MIERKILVVDDDPAICDLIADSLREAAFLVATAATGAEALRKISAEKPHLVILDLGLPEVSGDEVCRVIKTDPALRDIILIILSGKKDLQTKLSCLAIGAEEYLVKPVEMEEIVARVNRFLSLAVEW